MQYSQPHRPPSPTEKPRKQLSDMRLPVRLLRRDGPTIKIHWITNIYFSFIKEGNQSLTVNFLKLDAEFTPRLKSFRMPGFHTPETNVK